MADNKAATSANDETGTRQQQGHKGCSVTK